VGVVAFVLFVDYFLYGLVIPLTPLSPANVKTDRLCEASEEESRRRTPATARIASAIAATIPGRRPSLMFGTHSMSMRVPDLSARRCASAIPML